MSYSSSPEDPEIMADGFPAMPAGASVNHHAVAATGRPFRVASLTIDEGIVPDPSDVPAPRQLAILNPTAASALAANQREALPRSARPADECDEVDAALRLVERVRGKARYVAGEGWYVWDGRVWESIDTTGSANFGAMIRETCESIEDFVLSVMREPFTPTKGANVNPRIAKAKALKSNAHVQSILKLASSQPNIGIRKDAFDADKMILNCQNGIVDLQTGELRPHDRAAFCTKMAPVDYCPEARHPVLDRFLGRLDEVQPGMSAFLARVLGMSLTGDTEAETVFFILGEGGSGKTTLFDAFAKMMGPYSAKPELSAFLDNKFGKTKGSASPEILSLAGVRFAQVTESGDRSRFDAEAIKRMTGGEAVSGRNLHSSHYVTIDPELKLFVVSNSAPNIGPTDTGMRRRVVQLEFQAIPTAQRDPAVKTTLMRDPEARKALLAWAVQGCVEWIRGGRGREGLGISDFVKDTTKRYWERVDPLDDWLSEVVPGVLDFDFEKIEAGTVAESTYFVPRSEVHSRYIRWCDEHGVPMMDRVTSMKRFVPLMDTRGVLQHKMRYGPGKIPTNCWRGLRLTPVVTGGGVDGQEAGG